MSYKKREGYHTAFKGEIIEVLRKQTPHGIHEIARRSPGVRIIALTHDDKIMISRERRTYLQKEWDYRLPGGKVVDKLEDYLNLLKRLEDGFDGGDITDTIKCAVAKEGKEEIGITIRDAQLIHISDSGGTIEWDLWYWLVRPNDYFEGEQELEADEEIEILKLTPYEVSVLVLNKEISEDRSRAVLVDILIKHFREDFLKAVQDQKI